MKPNKATIDLIKRWEGCRLTAYRDSVNVLTIGYGLTTGALEGVFVHQGMVISQHEAESYLQAVLEKFGHQILPYMTRKPTDNQYGAMLSLAYNIGPGAFKKSTCLRRFNAGDMAGASEALTWFNKAGGKVLRGLASRREAERGLFMNGQASEPHSGAVDGEKTPVKSTTNWAAGIAGLSVAANASDDVKEIIGNLGVNPNWVLLAIIGAALIWIVLERIKKIWKFGV